MVIRGKAKDVYTWEVGGTVENTCKRKVNEEITCLRKDMKGMEFRSEKGG